MNFMPCDGSDFPNFYADVLSCLAVGSFGFLKGAGFSGNYRPLSLPAWLPKDPGSFSSAPLGPSALSTGASWLLLSVR